MPLLLAVLLFDPLRLTSNDKPQTIHAVEPKFGKPELWTISKVKKWPKNDEWSDPLGDEPTLTQQRAIGVNPKDEMKSVFVGLRGRDGSSMLVVTDGDSFLAQHYVVKGTQSQSCGGRISCLETAEHFGGYFCDYGYKATEESPRMAFRVDCGKKTELGPGTPRAIVGDVTVLETGFSNNRPAVRGYEEESQIRFVSPTLNQSYIGKQVLGVDSRGGVWFHTKDSAFFEEETETVARWSSGKIDRALRLPRGWRAINVTRKGEVLLINDSVRAWLSDSRLPFSVGLAWVRDNVLVPLKFGGSKTKFEATTPFSFGHADGRVFFDGRPQPLRFTRRS